MYRKIRICLAALFFIGLTLLLSGIGTECFAWMAKLQFLPSLLALNLTVVLGLLALTFVCGRIYCSVICPMGVFQDIVTRIHRTLDKKFKFKFHKENVILRNAVLAVSIATAIASGQLFISLVAPYSAYGRMVRTVTGLATGKSVALALIIVAAVTLVVVTVCAWLWGRAYCNSICPVGTTLSYVSRYSIFKPVIDKSACVSCGLCEKNCKAQCIDSKNKKIDYSRCIDCFDCMSNCKKGGIQYKNSYAKKETPAAADNGRRAFLATGALLGGSLISKAQNKRLDGGIADVTEKQEPERSERIVPFGAGSQKNFYRHCTACQLCVNNCPNQVLRPSTDGEHFLQPKMGFEKGYCRPECNVCSQLCPAGAILPVEKGEKLTMQIGIASVNRELCLACTGEASCGNCSVHCPTGAVRMVMNEELGRNIPVVDETQCIGCGACEFLCPSRPISAITVNGLSIHHKK